MAESGKADGMKEAKETRRRWGEMSAESVEVKTQADEVAPLPQAVQIVCQERSLVPAICTK